MMELPPFVNNPWGLDLKELLGTVASALERKSWPVMAERLRATDSSSGV